MTRAYYPSSLGKRTELASETGHVATHRGGRRMTAAWPVVIFALALAVRVVWALLAGRLDPFLRLNRLHGDAAAYDRIARNLLAGQGFAEFAGRATAFWPPLYPAFLAGLYSLLGHNLLLARLLQAVLGAATVLAAAKAFEGALGRRTAALAGLGMACYPYLVYFGTWLIAEALYLLLLCLSLLVATRMQARPTLRGYATLGLLLGLGALTKPAGLMLVPLLLVWVWVAPPARTGRVKLLQGALLLAVCVATLAPWTVRNYLVFRSFVPVSTNGGYTFYGANNAEAFGGHREGFPPHLPGLSEPEAEQEYYRLGTDWIRSDPVAFVRLAARKVQRLFSPLSVASWEQDYPLPWSGYVRAIYASFLVLSLLGLVVSLRRWREVFVFYAPILRVVIGALVFYGDVRYTLPMVPSLAAFAALGLTVLCSPFGRATLHGRSQW